MLLLLLAAGCGSSAAKTSDSLKVELGNAGRVQVGRWAPIVIRSTTPVAEKTHPEVIAADPDGLPVRFVLPDFAEGESRGEFLVGRADSEIRVEIHASDKPGAPLQALTLGTRNSDLRFMKPDVRFWGVFEEDPFLQTTLEKFVSELTAKGTGAAAHSPVEIHQLSAKGTSRPEGIEALFVTAPTLRRLAADSAPLEGLRNWIGRGGHLVVIPRGEPKDYAQEGLTSWFPITIDTTTPIRFRDLVILNKGITNRGLLRTQREGVPGIRLTTPTGRALASSVDGDLLVRAPYGRGGVTMLAIDAEAPPLHDWDGLPALLGSLADYTPTQESLKQQKTDLNPTGISDLQTQVLRTTNDFPEISRPSYWGALGLILLAFAVVGPIDFLIVHYVLKRPHWTWFTLVVWIAVLTFTGVAYARRVTGTTELANQIDLLDVDETLGRIGARSWFTLYGPQSRRVDLSIAPAKGMPVKTVDDSELRWAGRPEAGFRGMHRPGGLSLNEPGYTIEPQTASSPPRVVGYPLRPGSTCDVEGGWDGTLASPLVEVDLEGDMKSRLQGTFTSKLPGGVKDWFIAYGMFAFYAPLERRGYSIMTLRPGTRVEVKGLQARRIDDFLAGIVTTPRVRDDKKNNTNDDYTFTRAPYDHVGIDPYAIFKVVSFYKAVGGRSYTQLTNGPVLSLDRTSVVQNGHAVLFGRLEAPASEISVDTAAPETTHQSFVRVVLPVRQIPIDFAFPKIENK